MLVITCFCFLLIDSHSLGVFATFIIGKTDFPEFSVVLKIDDIQVGYYDSFTKKYYQRGNADGTQEDPDEQADSRTAFNLMYKGMKDRASQLKLHYNHSQGTSTHMSIYAYELLINKSYVEKHLNVFHRLHSMLCTVFTNTILQKCKQAVCFILCHFRSACSSENRRMWHSKWETWPVKVKGCL